MGVAAIQSQGAIRVPSSALSLEGFRHWARSARFPERGRMAFIRGEIDIDMSPEEIVTHNKVKVEISAVLHNRIKRRNLGQFYGDRTLLTNARADLSTEPDGTFVSWASLESNRVRLIAREGVADQFIEVEGCPDMVLEVVSVTSLHKDTVELKETYYRAGVKEYWLIDARSDAIYFRILQRGRVGFVTVPSQGTAGPVRLGLLEIDSAIR